MNSRKGQNSIIFLATLGVYLGLVLAGGAAPQVYAHAAMTRNFEIQEEIEVKDDIDDIPDRQDKDFPSASGSEIKLVTLANLDDLLKQFRRELPQSVFAAEEPFDRSPEIIGGGSIASSHHSHGLLSKPIGFRGLTVARFPRSSIDSPSVSDAR